MPTKGVEQVCNHALASNSLAKVLSIHHNEFKERINPGTKLT